MDSVDHQDVDREHPDAAEEGLIRAAKAYRRTEKAHEEARQELKRAAVRAIGAGVKQSEVVKVTGWTREYLRRLKKDKKGRDDD
ncbi:hypothetical protein [Embleya sp. AB8]|uniref:hypothetical protein n=1 Tax=Embleya sp. AB8 TaxID=3156304 RepID=UPI003C77AFAA